MSRSMAVHDVLCPACSDVLKCHSPFQSVQLAASCLRSRHQRPLETRRWLELSLTSTWVALSSPAPSASASGSRTLSKFSWLFKARPPDTTRDAEARSGRLDTVSSSLTNCVDATCQRAVTLVSAGALTIALDRLDLLHAGRARSHSGLVERGRADSDDLDGVLVARLDFQYSVTGVNRPSELGTGRVQGNDVGDLRSAGANGGQRTDGWYSPWTCRAHRLDEGRHSFRRRCGQRTDA